MHHLDGDLAIVAAMVREKHVRHPTCANLTFDGVAVREDRLEAIHYFHDVVRKSYPKRF